MSQNSIADTAKNESGSGLMPNFLDKRAHDKQYS